MDSTDRTKPRTDWILTISGVMLAFGILVTFTGTDPGISPFVVFGVIGLIIAFIRRFATIRR